MEPSVQTSEHNEVWQTVVSGDERTKCLTRLSRMRMGRAEGVALEKVQSGYEYILATSNHLVSCQAIYM